MMKADLNQPQNIEDICKNVHLITDKKLEAKIQEIIRKNNQVVYFSLFANQEVKKYILNIKLKNFQKEQAEKIYSNFITEIQYKDIINSTVDTDDDDMLSYDLISVDEQLKGFFCHITFY